MRSVRASIKFLMKQDANTKLLMTQVAESNATGEMITKKRQKELTDEQKQRTGKKKKKELTNEQTHQWGSR